MSKNYPVRREKRLFDCGKSIPMQKAYRAPAGKDIHHQEGVHSIEGTLIIEEGINQIMNPQRMSRKLSH